MDFYHQKLHLFLHAPQTSWGQAEMGATSYGEIHTVKL
ncbi:hypothetical protein CLSA_c11730 [Clostridium saccharobutylicum DSM 13864]|uniref:Uncharacterized protein n=1 Tax=Clostridium saccharobutylicum DSM 13864 TaxID=1345695 RepID=U5MNT0_CLOSA|nr:hypothetical protein CLSA_c11730 [Clostridium saccharobutylicum DSM 13864]